MERQVIRFTNSKKCVTRVVKIRNRNRIDVLTCCRLELWLQIQSRELYGRKWLRIICAFGIGDDSVNRQCSSRMQLLRGFCSQDSVRVVGPSNLLWSESFFTRTVEPSRYRTSQFHKLLHISLQLWRKFCLSLWTILDHAWAANSPILLVGSETVRMSLRHDVIPRFFSITIYESELGFFIADNRINMFI